MQSRSPNQSAEECNPIYMSNPRLRFQAIINRVLPPARVTQPILKLGNRNRPQLQAHCDAEEASDALRLPRRRTPFPPDNDENQPFNFPLNFPQEPRDDEGLAKVSLELVTAVDVDASLPLPLVGLVDREREDEEVGLTSPLGGPRRHRREGVDAQEVLRERWEGGAESSDVLLIVALSACASRRVEESAWS